MVRSFVVEVNPAVIKWARKSAGWVIEEVARELKISGKDYKQIEAGIKKPTYLQIKNLAKIFRRPVSALFLPKPPEERTISLSFRVLPFPETKISKELRLAIRKARYYQSISNEIMRALGERTVSRTASCKLDDDPKQIAQRERQSMGISVEEQIGWGDIFQAFKAWRSAIEDKNILVFQFKFPLEEARGFLLMDNQPYLIALNSRDNILAKIFTMFHEYAHILLGITEIYHEEKVTNTKVEVWCNTFAGELLLPYEAIKNDKDFQALIHSRKFSTQALEMLSQRYKVSKKAILVRLRILNLIDEQTYQKQVQVLETIKSARKKGRLTPVRRCLKEKGRKFVSTILEAKEENIITQYDVIDYLSLKLKHLDELYQVI